MTSRPLHIVFVGLSITSSWGNGHATNFRGLIRALSARGHTVTFLERDVPWYATHRDLPQPPYCTTILYGDVDELRDEHRSLIASADLVVMGSYVPDGIDVARWLTSTAEGVTAFYDIDTPITLAGLENGSCSYLCPALVGAFDLYLSFTGGPTLRLLERHWGAQRARPFYCMVDPEVYTNITVEPRWSLGYLGTYSTDRQPTLERLLIGPAGLVEAPFVVAGPGYPPELDWAPNIERIDHIPPGEHAAFYSAQRFTLNITRADMVRAGWSPSVRLFEAAACGTPIISDWWSGLEHFFIPGVEILLADSCDDVVHYLESVDDERRERLAAAARATVLRSHTAERRAEELEQHADWLLTASRSRR
jgi:spore maturation protein CgeB